MPLGRLVYEIDNRADELKQQLLQEWAEPHDDSKGPVIIETNDKLRSQPAPTHLYVFWDAWRDLSQRQRSEMIMDVYEAVKGSDSASNVTVAMGLTPEEAERMGMRYETLH